MENHSPTQTAAPATRVIERTGHCFQVTDSHPDFWTEFGTLRWEPETFAIFDHYLDAATVHLDVGAWIGPTVLYAATRARQVIGFEPDPVAFAALQANLALNPQLTQVKVHQVAITRENGTLTMGTRDQPGDSMSSSLFAGGAVNWTVPARRLEEFEADWPADAPVFLKIDIEGGEYDLLPGLADFVRRRRPVIYLSLHSHFFLGRSTTEAFPRKLAGELRLLAKFLRCWPVFRQYPFVYDGAGRRLRWWELWHRRTWRRTPSLLFARRPLPENFTA